MKMIDVVAQADVDAVKFQTFKSEKVVSWMNALLLENANIEERDGLLIKLNENGVHSQPLWTLMHRLPMYQNCPRMDLSGAENLEARLIQVPSGAYL